ncbi:phosphopantetheine-binding protein [Shinella yambaruensis]|uniref:Acyl carrier protein n=1 Tax=Shinella yambaruensis TaxID=415996 RepID=A0ABQ5ZSR0_9HYPH|nr:phosphopantetheine-binding protein [Shinella yambaruensis]MCJ8030041.1 phosphopantetheine-binding protein [Shinella yambaruensis]MCU7984333.1 phosphopantetheine-binding protein [Shinella yambaruensis]GLR55161.1 hypothetical protein GCM10007923_63820 [Shinella yambaruensis]
MSDVFDRLKSGIADYPGIDIDMSKVTRAAHLRDDLGFDSLDEVALELLVEEEFGIFVPVGSSDEWRTISNVVAFVEDAIGSKGQADE